MKTIFIIKEQSHFYLDSQHLRCLGTGGCFQGHYKLGFCSLHPPLFMSPNLPILLYRLVDLHVVLMGLLEAGVIATVPVAEQFQGFYFNLFIVSIPKPIKKSSLCFLCFFQGAKCLLSDSQICMKFTRSVNSFFPSGDFLASVDIKNEYLQVPRFF